MKVAIIGAGISGLTTAYMLRQLHEIDIFEADSEPGGHARTVEIHEPNGVVRLDVGFMVYNETTYKGFSGLLNELDIPSQSSLMSFGMSCRNCNLEYGTGSPASPSPTSTCSRRGTGQLAPWCDARTCSPGERVFGAP